MKQIPIIHAELNQHMTSPGTDTDGQIQLRKMQLSHMDGLMRLKDAEGWNQLEKDWALLISYKESVNLVAVLDKRIVGTVTAINYANRVAWIGMMLVDIDYRGRGIARQLMLHAIDKLNKCKSIKLDATPAGKPLYLKLGFEVEYTLYRMTHPCVSKISMGDNPFKAEKIRQSDMNEIAAFDAQVFGANRRDLIRLLFEGCPESAWLIKEDNRLAGFCLGRRGQNFTQIGPVCASSGEYAAALIRSAINQLTGKALVVDIPADKSDTLHWLEECGFKSQRPFDRMYLHNNSYPGSTGSLYLIAGPELG